MYYQRYILFLWLTNCIRANFSLLNIQKVPPEHHPYGIQIGIDGFVGQGIVFLIWQSFTSCFVMLLLLFLEDVSIGGDKQGFHFYRISVFYFRISLFFIGSLALDPFPFFASPLFY